jgi:hypothetical protein
MWNFKKKIHFFSAVTYTDDAVFYSSLHWKWFSWHETMIFSIFTYFPITNSSMAAITEEPAAQKIQSPQKQITRR